MLQGRAGLGITMVPWEDSLYGLLCMSFSVVVVSALRHKEGSPYGAAKYVFF